MKGNSNEITRDKVIVKMHIIPHTEKTHKSPELWKGSDLS